MRAREFIYEDKVSFKNKDEERKFIYEYLNPRIDSNLWMEIAYEFQRNNTLLSESVNDLDTSSLLDSLVSFGVSDPIIGNQYIPLLIYIFGQTVKVSDINGNIPPSESAKLCKLLDISNNSFIFNVDNRKTKFPTDAFNSIAKVSFICLPDKNSYDKLRTFYAMKTGDILPNFNSDNLQENASAGATSSGSVATVSMPLGGMVRRNNLLGGQETSEEYPNTPDWIKKAKKQWNRLK